MTDADRKAAKRATFFLTARHKCSRRKAARALHTDMTRPDLSPDELLEKLRDLHPPRAHHIPLLPDAAALRPPLTVDAAEVVEVFKTLSRAAAPGPSKLTEELMAAAVVDPTVATQVARILRDILSARVSLRVRLALIRCRLIAAGKPQDAKAVRPIAVGECLMKAAGTIGVQHCSDHILSIFKGLQYGILAPNGGEAIIHEFRDHMANNPDDAIGTLDCSNAFNATHRAAMAKALYADQDLSPLWKLWDFAYNIDGDLSLMHEGVEYTIKSSEGSRQGDVLGLLSFCLALHPILREIQAAHPLVKVRAYVDDINLAGSTEAVCAAIRMAVPLLAAIGLIVNSKSEIYTQHAIPDDLVSLLTVRRSAIKILGAQIGSDDSLISQWITAKVAKHGLFFHRLHVMERNSALVIARDCGVPRMNFLLRTHSPSLTEAGAAAFDGHISKLLHHLLDEPGEFSVEAACLIALPGGLRIPNMTSLRGPCYHGCRDSLPHNLCAPQDPVAGRMDQEARTALVNDRLAEQVDSLGTTERVHRKACAIKSSSLVFGATYLKFVPREWSAATRWRVGLPVQGTESWRFCPGCKHRFVRARELQEHLPSCPLIKGQNATTTHHQVNHANQQLARLSLIEFWNEPRYRDFVPPDAQEEHEQGPDCTFYLAPRPLSVDVKGVGLANLAHREKSTASVEASRRSRAIELYATHCAEQGEDFVSAVFHYTGGLCPVFKALVDQLASPAVEAGVLSGTDAVVLVQAAILRGVGRTLSALRR